ncbi:MAG: hypothetical protein LBT86_02340 [Deltaproteobacteria bacterium]|jgi:hypothetical protein|nr:hypothetical protein [Deltaproteobacteria bacterium]
MLASFGENQMESDLFLKKGAKKVATDLLGVHRFKEKKASLGRKEEV